MNSDKIVVGSNIQSSTVLLPVAEIPSRVSAMHGAIDIIEKQISTIFGCIDPVLMSDLPTAIGTQKQTALSGSSTKLGGDIQAGVTRLTDLSERLSNLISRVAL